ncbi:hypothetical protein [Actinocorallia herbida]|nr:hypothetical protein [Actinocorallia herbida]
MRISDLRSRPADESAKRIAEAIEGAGSARTRIAAVRRDQSGAKVGSHSSGIADFRTHLASMRSEETGLEQLAVGPDLLHRLAPEAREQVGKSWLRSPNCPYYAGERAELVAAFRLGVAEPKDFSIEDGERERLHHHVFELKARRSHRDPVIARLYAHLRHHGCRSLTYHVWLTEDGRLEHTREHVVLPLLAQRLDHPLAWTVDHWDFGVAVEIEVPGPDEIYSVPDDPGDPGEHRWAALSPNPQDRAL